MTPATVPAATYRLQFNASFTFETAADLVDYLDALGVSHCYASSYLAAVPGSTHGYDVTDPSRLSPEIGGEGSYARWIQALRSHGMGHILDVVPNHMGIAKSANPWWQDVLENGPNSRQARVFDIDWYPLKPELRDKVLLPILGDSYGAVLERQEIRLEYVNGAFQARYGDRVLPISPGTYDLILDTRREALLDALGPDNDDAVEFLSLLTAIRHLPERHVSDPALRAERAREKEVIKRRLAALGARSPQVRGHIAQAVEILNGRPGDPHSFDGLDTLLAAQSYRLAHWRVAAEEINYRRFFDINELAAIRMEDEVVFDRVHALVFDLVARGALDGLRIDHVHSLYDPGNYLKRVQQRARDIRPDLCRNEEYLLYQTLVGSWPLAPMGAAAEREYCDRIVAYMHKAMREAKMFTNWITPSERHEQAMTRFIETVLAPDNRAFRDDFLQFERRVARYGIYNSLAQLALKIGAPGVPDFYQGTEIWDFSLVDPDNRRPVDYARRGELLQELETTVALDGPAATAARLMANPGDDRLKLYTTSTLLRFRRGRLAIFQRGGYDPLRSEGARREHVFAFARAHGAQLVVIAVPRLVATLVPDADVPPLGERVWGDTSIELRPGGPAAYRHALTGDCVRAREDGGRVRVAAAEVFAQFPVAFLEAL
ncbi:MAG: hypothetical protein HYY76_20650 [Acidobacteria bacterium]|nr:hypothetical protein [Acidobacteriota bacterium]